MTEPTDSRFQDLGIAPGLMKRIGKLRFKNPTPVQREAIPVGLLGNDILATAQTGSGKTLAFGIPMLQRLAKLKRGVGLVLVPTRELALQVDESLRTIAQGMNIRSVVVIGGASLLMQQKALRKNPRVIIATPGRFIDHIARRNVYLDGIKILVLDEADRMLDMGFAPDIKRIIAAIPEGRQTMLFSATMPKEIEQMAGQMMDDPARIEIDRSGVTPAEVSHEMFFIHSQDKSRLLAVRLQKCSGPVLVFTRTKRMASRLTTKVNRMGFSAAEIHSNRSLGQRRHALDGFKRGRYQILIATDIAARGIDVTGIELVVNYDMPANSEDYVHRIGRTGRAGKTGHAISFATNDQRHSVRSLERFMKTKLSVSATPSLPSEMLLMKKAGQWDQENDSADGAPATIRSFTKRRPAKDNGARKRKSGKSAARQTKTQNKNFKRKSSARPFGRSPRSKGSSAGQSKVQ